MAQLKCLFISSYSQSGSKRSSEPKLNESKLMAAQNTKDLLIFTSKKKELSTKSHRLITLIRTASLNVQTAPLWAESVPLSRMQSFQENFGMKSQQRSSISRIAVPRRLSTISRLMKHGIK